MNEIICGDSLTVLKTLESESVDCCVTSPPYWGLRDYGCEGQFGLEKTPEEYVAKMVEIFREVKRVLKKEGVVFLNLGDSYYGSNQGRNGDGSVGKITSKIQKGNKGSLFPDNVKRVNIYGISEMHPKIQGLKPKDLVGIPWRVAFALQADGWYLRQDIIWHKPNPMPESVTDRCTKSHEYVFLMTKSAKYYFDGEAIREPFQSTDKKYPAINTKQGIYAVSNNHNRAGGNAELGRNKRSVWTVPTKPYSGAHFATFPDALIVPMIKAGCPEGGIVLDCFGGAMTTAMVALKLNRKFITVELNAKYCQLGKERIENEVGTLLNKSINIIRVPVI